MSQPIYQPLFLDAFKTVWHHKRLWFLGIPAFFMASGGLFETVSHSWQNALTGRQLIEQAVNGTLPGYQWLMDYSRYLSQLTPIYQYTITLVVLLLIVLGIFLGAICQGAILSGALEKKPLGLHELWQKGGKFFGRLLALDILGKFFTVLLFIIAVLPVAFMNPLPYGWYKFPPFISFIVFVAGAIFISIIQMLSLTATVRKHLNVRAAIAEAWHIFRLHVLVCLELGFLLFITSLLATGLTFVALYVLALPITALFILAIATASAALYTLTIILSVLLILATIFLIFGFLTAFQYTIWSLFFEEMERFGIISWFRRRFKR